MTLATSKLANWYYFIFILSQNDNHSDFVERKKYLIESIGQVLSEEEVWQLENFKKIDTYFKTVPSDVIFAVYKNPWSKVKKEIGSIRTTQLKKIFSCFKAKFEIFWAEEEKNILRAKGYYQKNEGIISSLVNHFSVLVGTDRFDFNRPNIYFLFSAPMEISGWFSEMYSKTDIIMESSPYPFR